MKKPPKDPNKAAKSVIDQLKKRKKIPSKSYESPAKGKTGTHPKSAR